MWPQFARSSRAERWSRDSGTPARPKGQAVNALLLARAWEVEIEAGVVNRAGVARREGVSRARVTQVMSLLDLPEDVQQRLLTGEVIWSIRKALRQVGR